MIAAPSIQQPPPQPNPSKYYMDSRPGPSPPETYDYANPTARTSTSSTSPSPTSIFGPPHEYRRAVRQIYPPKTPLYIPAALRPTELPARPTNIPNFPRAPDTPPASNGNSFDSAESNSSPSVHLPDNSPHPPAQEWDAAALSAQLTSATFQEPDTTDEEVSGPPVTSHWKPNETSHTCIVCNATFTWYFRRHHCRKCGYVVCGQHSQNTVLLDQNARFHPRGHLSRACDPCYANWQRFKELRLSRASSVHSDGNADTAGNTTPSLRVPEQSLQQHQQAPSGADPRSLGFYGNWSTF